jgi:pimeloyl-ACP methyl ester carboxylesterase
VQRRADALAREDVEGLMRLQAEFVYSEENAAELRRIAIARCHHLPRETILSFYDPDPDMNIVPILSSISVPTLVAHGRADRLINFAAAEYAAARIPGAQLTPSRARGITRCSRRRRSSATC